MRSRLAPLVVASLLMVGCQQSEEQPIPTRSPGPATAVEALTQVHRGLVAGDFDTAANLTLAKHAALAALAEGATFTDVATALREDDIEVAANFWSGFAQAADESFLGDVVLSDAGTVEVGESSFALVDVASEGAQDRRLVAQLEDGYRVDLFASFGSGLSSRMISPVEILLTSATDDALLILLELREVADSLQVAVSAPNVSAADSQSILQLIELITRVS